MTQISHSRSGLRVNRFKCVQWCVCVPTTVQGNIVLEQRLREVFGMKAEGVAEG